MNRQKQKTLLCLDLEGTLISNAISQIPRPGLYPFLEAVSEACDLMLYTSVSSERVNVIRNLLVEEGVAPVWFPDLAVLHPTGTIKDKARCGRSDALLLDDQAAVIAPGEEYWWVPIAEYLPPYSDYDYELVKALATIKSRLNESD
ncbi:MULTISPECIES: NIF family HAD-type phosphatase [unclassified Marinobacter]|uniref:NIF family HAD-type phosphatase n=1 Tax=unclassified Marinobacter TaxID=83889 RepID=UPI001267B67B|nr:MULTISPECIES: NIF family HAD-type phosphatase [unclassified Marinobacter]QFS88946.1 NLI interacting factor-like phosphatase [Marinobacter sp. THAF197a]QFT52731.1 NLI interacting factor-like phosphatase [Marinobacter sp. THAF39]